MKCFSTVYRNNQMRLLLSCNVVNGRNRIPKAHPFFHSLSFHMPCNLLLKVGHDILDSRWASLIAQLIKNPPAMWDTWI